MFSLKSTKLIKKLVSFGRGVRRWILCIHCWRRDFFFSDGIWWNLIPFSTHKLDRLVQLIAAQLTIVRAKATNTVKKKRKKKSWPRIKIKWISLTIEKFWMIPVRDIMLTCKFPSDSGIMGYSCVWSLLFFYSCYVKLKIRYQVSIKTFLYGNLLENFTD